MKWVVGTGRCGMHNYTALHGGFIQSREAWKELALKRYHDALTEEDERIVEEVIRERMSLPFPFITDCAQFMFMDRIKEIDESASFVWLQGRKEDVILGFMEKGNEDKRIHPKGWKFSPSTKPSLLSWYYEEVNRIIKENLAGASYKHILSHALPRASQEAIEALRVHA